MLTPARKNPARRLAELFHRNGYIRRCNMGRRRRHGWQVYKKGDEVRLTASSQGELAEIRRLLGEAGFKAGRPFVKGRQYRQPLYGRTEVARFLSLIGVPYNDAKTDQRQKRRNGMGRRRIGYAKPPQ